jgi:CheY-like chemotaxis protein
VESACILLAEDEATVRRSVRRMLDRAGFKVLEARHGADALMVLAENGDAVDLLITDLRMPELGGHELIATLRARMPDLPVIAMSGYPPERDAEPEWQGLDEVEFLSKPFSTEMLMDAVRRALGRS